MTDQTPHRASGAARSAGTLLREAREKRGMHIAALASAIKVAPARLEALEDDDYSAMPDTTFARALAQAVCRALKADPAPVLALMPETLHSRLERVDEGLNAPFRDRPGRIVEPADLAPWRYPVAWIALALLMAAAAFLWWPQSPVVGTGAEPTPPGAEPTLPATPPPAGNIAAESTSPAEPASSAPSLPAPTIAPATASTGAVPSASGQSTAGTPAAVAPAGVAPPGAPNLPILAAPASALPAASGPGAGGDQAVLTAVQNTWVQVVDGRGKVLAARTLVKGESVNFDGPLPLKVRIGNVQGTELSFRGRAIELKSMTRDNTLLLTLPQPGQP